MICFCNIYALKRLLATGCRWLAFYKSWEIIGYELINSNYLKQDYSGNENIGCISSSVL